MDINSKIASRMESLPFSRIRVVMEKAVKMQKEGKSVIHMELGRPDFDTPQKIKDAVYKSINDGHVFYTSNYGTPEIRKAVAEFELRKNGSTYEPEEVLITVGAGEAVYDSLSAFLNPGDEVLVPDPVWLNYIHVPESLGAKPVTYSLLEKNDYQIDFDELKSKITDKTKMMVIVDPCNPTGGVFTRETMEKLAEIAIKNDLIIISDEIYEQLVYDGSKHTSIASLPGMKERTIKVGGWSKAYSMTGWRLGYLCAPKEIIAAVVRVHQYIVTCASSFVQDAAVCALQECDEDVEKMRQQYEERKHYIVNEINSMDGVSCNDPKGAFYVFMNIKGLNMTSFEVSEYFLDAGVATVPGSAFGESGEGYIRLSYAAGMDDLKEACSRMRKAIENLKK